MLQLDHSKKYPHLETETAGMMFIHFCRAHSLLVDYVIHNGKWHRVKPVDHTHKKNGAYIYDGVRGAVQNWATMEKAESWKIGRAHV